MTTGFLPTTHLCKDIARFTLASSQGLRTLTHRHRNAPQTNAPQTNAPERKTFERKNNHRSPNLFNDEGTPGSVLKNISLISPKDFNKVLYHDFKLTFVEEERKSKNPGVELLRNIAANYDYWMVRKNQGHLLYYRLEMMLQRIAFLKSVGLDSKQKLSQIQKQPPPILFTFTDCSYTAKLVYLRGLLHKDEAKFIHLFYPVSKKIIADQRSIEVGVKKVEEELRIKQPAAIRELLNMPCFFMDPSELTNMEHMLVHRHSMPHFFDVDKHTAQVLPPICDLTSLGLSTGKHLANNISNSLVSSLPTYQSDAILDYRYPVTNGKGTPECLTSFLMRADLEEEKDRTGGQPVRGRRGFNVPARQY